MFVFYQQSWIRFPLAPVVEGKKNTSAKIQVEFSNIVASRYDIHQIGLILFHYVLRLFLPTRMRSYFSFVSFFDSIIKHYPLTKHCLLTPVGNNLLVHPSRYSLFINYNLTWHRRRVKINNKFILSVGSLHLYPCSTLVFSSVSFYLHRRRCRWL